MFFEIFSIGSVYSSSFASNRSLQHARRVKIHGTHATPANNPSNPAVHSTPIHVIVLTIIISKSPTRPENVFFCLLFGTFSGWVRCVCNFVISVLKTWPNSIVGRWKPMAREHVAQNPSLPSQTHLETENHGSGVTERTSRPKHYVLFRHICRNKEACSLKVSCA